MFASRISCGLLCIVLRSCCCIRFRDCFKALFASYLSCGLLYIVLLSCSCLGFKDCLRIVYNTVLSCMMTLLKSQNTMRKFLFEGCRNANSSDGLGFDSVGYVRAAPKNSTATVAVVTGLYCRLCARCFIVFWLHVVERDLHSRKIVAAVQAWCASSGSCLGITFAWAHKKEEEKLWDQSTFSRLVGCKTALGRGCCESEQKDFSSAMQGVHIRRALRQAASCEDTSVVEACWAE